MPIYITWILIAFIIIVFICFLCEANKLWRCRIVISKILKREDIVKSLEESKLSAIATSYQKNIAFEVNGEKKSNIPASEFFFETSIGKAINLNYRMIGTASGTLVGLGLLGTFLGLTVGIAGLDRSNTDNILSGIQSLMDGMGTAFSTSLVGMFLSLIYTAFEKRWKNQLGKALYDLTERLDDAYYIDDSSLMQNNQQNLFNALQSKFAKYTEVQTAAITAALENQLSYTNNEGNKVVIANAIREILKENEEQSKALIL